MVLSMIKRKPEDMVLDTLYRKQISNNYHTTVPKFMRSQGPFAVYDHSAHKGAHANHTVGSVNEQALGRFNAQVGSL